MTKYEFLKGLREALEGTVSEAQINENISYYDRYVTDEIIKGRSEEDVVAELGNPRLIAKTISETAGPDNSKARTYSDTDDHATYSTYNRTHTTKVPGWLVSILGVIALILAVVIIVAIISGILWLFVRVVLPIVLVALLVGFVVRLFRK